MRHRVTTIARTSMLPDPPAVAFAVVMSPETAPLIDPAVRVWAADHRPIDRGTRFTIRGRLGKLPIRGVSEVVIWDPPAMAEFRPVAPSWPIRMTAVHTFAPRGDGTRYTWSISFQERSILGRPVITFLARRFEHALEAQATALTKYLADLPAGMPPPAL